MSNHRLPVSFFRFSAVCLALGLATACTRPGSSGKAATAEAARDYVIRYERTPCMGKCPAFVAEFTKDGILNYTGGANAVPEGTAQVNVGKEVVAEVLKQADEIRFDKMPADQYGKGMTDAPSAIVTINRNGRVKQVICVGGECPEELKGLHRTLDAEIKRVFTPVTEVPDGQTPADDAKGGVDQGAAAPGANGLGTGGGVAQPVGDKKDRSKVRQPKP